MELTPRKQAVLKAIVKAYIETGEPVGSKILTSLLDNAPSSATLRNEMSELCELGLLKQPHTSAGRVPTAGGYKLYVDNLMSENEINSQTAEYIDSALRELSCEPEEIPRFAAKLLTELTGLPAISCLITDRPPKIKQLQLLPIGRYSFMLVILTDDGRARNKILRCGKNLSEGANKCFNDIYKAHIKYKTVDTLTKGYMQSLLARSGIYALELMPIFTSIFETAADIEDKTVHLSGENALYNISGSENEARRILSLIKSRDPFISILEDIGDGAGAVFGADTGYEELLRDTIVAAKFSTTDNYKGYVGVIGPIRMSYDRIMPTVKYTAKRLSEIMTEAQRDMVD